MIAFGVNPSIGVIGLSEAGVAEGCGGVIGLLETKVAADTVEHRDVHG